MSRIRIAEPAAAAALTVLLLAGCSAAEATEPTREIPREPAAASELNDEEMVEAALAHLDEAGAFAATELSKHCTAKPGATVAYYQGDEYSVCASTGHDDVAVLGVEFDPTPVKHEPLYTIILLEDGQVLFRFSVEGTVQPSAPGASPHLLTRYVAVDVEAAFDPAKGEISNLQLTSVALH